MFAQRMNKAWRARRGSTAIDPVMRFSDRGLVLGAGTVLAKSAGSGREISIDPAEPRLQALLAAAHMCMPTVGALAHLCKAGERWSEGQDALAAMHLALSGLDRLARPAEDAHRLFLADGLIEAGIEAGSIVGAIGRGASPFERLHKYDPDQPRVPAGSGETSGQWTSGGGGSSLSPDQNEEVNPSTITEVDYYDACEVARKACFTAAIKVDMQSANDNGLGDDLNKCRMANFVCNVLSVAIEDIPLLDYGGVIFPHQGVVIMKKGYQDRYIPPLSDGSRPAFRRTR